jgi:urea transporter
MNGEPRTFSSFERGFAPFYDVCWKLFFIFCFFVFTAEASIARQARAVLHMLRRHENSKKLKTSHFLTEQLVLPTMALLMRTATAAHNGLSRGPLCTQAFFSWVSIARSMTTTKKEESEQDKPHTATNRYRSFTESSLRGVGQVVFCNSSTSGLVILGGLAVGDPYVAALAALGTVSATTAATVGGLDKDALHNGLWGYNGCLVGCAAAIFVSPLPESLQSPLLITAATSGLLTTVAGGAASSFVAASLKPAMGTVPQWTLAFNFVTLTMLLHMQPFAGNVPEIPTPVTSLHMLDIAMNAPLKGISQIFVVESSLTGAALVGGIALYSPGLAAHLVMGSSIGAISGICMGADAGEIASGLWGFNSALTSIGVGVFFCPSLATYSLSAGGAATTAALFGAMKAVFAGWDAPCLTLPFCISMSGCYLLRDAIPGLVLASDPHSPEKNETRPSQKV